PDPSTFKILPWRGTEYPVGRVFCDVLKPGGEPYEGDPRYVMRRALDRAREIGFDHYYLGPELEFFLFKDDQGTQVLDRRCSDLPDPSTFKILPWRGTESPVGRVFCDVLKPGGEPYEGDPRYVMRRALDRAKELGFDHYYLGPELEFFLFKDDQGTEVLDRGGYFDLTTLDVASDFRRDVVFTLRDLGIPVEYTHHEVGPSQHEIDMRFAEGLTMADNTMTYRIAVKEVALAHGYYATFMPKPLFGENGSGMHTHQSLFRGETNAFFDADDEYFLSDTAKAFIAGQPHHARELSALFAPSVNSYKRLVPGYEAPVYIAWSRRNRSALVRVPVYHPGKERATRAELRCPDPSCNPYLTFAALLHAGLEGIEKGY